ncbi:hypothetical protein N9A94_02170 [Akkermansiaceae bacterium]|nr:hypothetical protein [Akkermansiaceae bacterium]
MMKFRFTLIFAPTVLPLSADLIFSEDFSGGDGGFISTEVGGATFPWLFNAATTSWRLDGDTDLGFPTRNNLTSPVIDVTGTETLEIRFDHRYSIEGGQWDGGALFVSRNGGLFEQVPAADFTQNGYTAFSLIGNHDLSGGDAFGGNSPGYETETFITSVAQIPGLAIGDTLQLQFVGACDEFTRGEFLPNWEITSVAVDTLTDGDGDGMPDNYESANGLNPNVNDADDDLDLDTVSNFTEFENGTDPQDKDSDDDGLEDNVETNTGIFLNAGNTGTDPLKEDTDEDGIRDDRETGTGVFVDAENTGTDPNVPDTDMDGTKDGEELLDGTDPTDQSDFLRILYLDFNSTNQGGGPNAVGSRYQNYDAGHEVDVDFVTQTYPAFGTIVSLTPTWPDTTDSRVKQMIDRGAGNDANWTGTDLQLVTDFLGIDTRTGSGGNGDYDGTNGSPTTLLLTLSDLPGGTYDLTSFHHDTENVHTPFLVDISVDGGATFDPVEGGNSKCPQVQVAEIRQTRILSLVRIRSH